jgi:formate-dependent phosphoribosylglycinamide formyltransferase (GAR transformylase)
MKRIRKSGCRGAAQVAHRSHVIAMTDEAALRQLVLQEKPDLVCSRANIRTQSFVVSRMRAHT